MWHFPPSKFGTYIRLRHAATKVINVTDIIDRLVLLREQWINFNATLPL
jgi:hypothetical protein